MRNVEGEKKKKKKNEQREAEGFLNLEGKKSTSASSAVMGLGGGYTEPAHLYATDRFPRQIYR